MTIAARILGPSTTQPPLPPYFPLYARRFRATARLAARVIFSRVDLYLETAVKDKLKAAKIVVYANHPGFWDPVMLALLTERLWPNHAILSPIDREGLNTHRYFHGLGFFALNPASVSGLRKFIGISRAAWSSPTDNCLAVLPEGQFSPPGARELKLRRGLARALTAHQGPPPTVVPVAITYQMGQNPRPVASLAVGEPLVATSGTLESLQHSLEFGLHSTLSALEANILESKPCASLLRSPCR